QFHSVERARKDGCCDDVGNQPRQISGEAKPRIVSLGTAAAQRVSLNRRIHDVSATHTVSQALASSAPGNNLLSVGQAAARGPGSTLAEGSADWLSIVTTEKPAARSCSDISWRASAAIEASGATTARACAVRSSAGTSDAVPASSTT